MKPTFEQIETEVRRLAAESPDFIYGTYHGTCFYKPTEKDGKMYGACIFGQALKNVGVHDPLPEGVNIFGVLERLGIPVTLREGSWVSRVQMLQDSGIPWGEAVEKADRTYPKG